MKSKEEDSSNPTLKINEIFYSIQGESTHSGKPCVFIRLTYCNLRCSYCDTEYAFMEGETMRIPDIINRVAMYNCKLVEITGGEPLLQQEVHILMKNLCDSGYEVLLETAGHMDISYVDNRVKRIMDIKCPSSGEVSKNLWDNINVLTGKDEVKFVIGDREDFDWAVGKIKKHNINKICVVIFSPVFDKINYAQLAAWILQDHIPVRMQLQLHKFIWSPDKRGV
jgi:7-carboxy-7-deazaguanine synthase